MEPGKKADDSARIPLVEFRGISRFYGSGEAEVRALDGVDMRVYEGEFVAVMGPSGSGKSTAMNIIGCLDTPTAGHYLFNGVEAGQLTRDQRALLRRHYIGFVFQGFNLLARSTALENVELPLIYKGMAHRERVEKARTALAKVGLQGRESHMPSQLSGGQQQRVAIARALAGEPMLILADEPTGNLDTKRSVEIMDLLTELNRNDGITIIMVTHEEDMAAYASRLVTFIDGRISHDKKSRSTRDMLGETIRLAIQAITRNALRSFLTVLGVVIGVAAVIALVTIGQGSSAQVTADVESLGSNTLIIRPGSGMGPGTRDTANPFTIADADAIGELSVIAAAAPASSSSVTAVFGNANITTTVTGTTHPYLDINNRKIVRGRTFNDAEERAGSAVCLIGETVRQDLFGNSDPTGERIRLKNFACDVVGLLEAQGASSFGRDQDDVIIMPIRTLQRRIAGNTDVALIYAELTPSVSAERGIRDINALLRERRRIATGEQDDFSVTDMKQISSMLSGVSNVLTGLLSSVAAVSLLVGGIGIMNIMLVSVTERTREIGIRLAVGAQASQVLAQFLVEAVVLSLIGGTIGILLGLAMAAAASSFMAIPFTPDPVIIFGAFVFSALVGVVFGYFPARAAARLDPIEALRYQ